MAKKGSGAKIVFIIILFILIAGSLAVGFNVGGLKDLALSFIGRQGGGHIATSQAIEGMELEREKDELNAEKIKLSALRTDLENYKAQLAEREKELDQKEIQLADKEFEVDRLKDRLSEQFQDLKEIVRIYQEMDGEEGARILSQMEDSDQVLLIIKNLKKEKSAEILGLMDPKRAADILSQIY